ncbi:hypothetical protein DFJ58DRAFT_667927 [Suillus subalutaceus]|uniref:uncharacterized protein n=1 Tax=Suillus subalutaceus TaxID=48586 RepID=UPI001B867A80|nr:uncharacterized protein DFJ58DRAFT_667927 [Suillus subalutaceus]KAG1839105.1 hypothetical protein DFJ58DRAFT_667927 [Suillus subalutaceus]
MTTHKAQGQTMQRAIIDFEGCSGTEAPYVMLLRVTSLDGLLILRPFLRKKFLVVRVRTSTWKKKDKLCWHTKHSLTSLWIMSNV